MNGNRQAILMGGERATMGLAGNWASISPVAIQYYECMHRGHVPSLTLALSSTRNACMGSCTHLSP